MVVAQSKEWCDVVNDDLGKAERQWANRSLFRPQRRRRRWVWIVLVFAIALTVFAYAG